MSAKEGQSNRPSGKFNGSTPKLRMLVILQQGQQMNVVGSQDE